MTQAHDTGNHDMHSITVVINVYKQDDGDEISLDDARAAVADAVAYGIGEAGYIDGEPLDATYDFFITEATSS